MFLRDTPAAGQGMSSSGCTLLVTAFVDYGVEHLDEMR
jgi:hypothetical protein